jgi:hypothetical protein
MDTDEHGFFGKRSALRARFTSHPAATQTQRQTSDGGFEYVFIGVHPWLNFPGMSERKTAP